MNFTNYIILILLAVISALLDTSFFSFLDVWNATVLLTFQILIVLSLLRFKNVLIVFAALSILLYASLSSLPIIFLIVAFLLIPLLIVYLGTKITFESNFPLILLSFLLINLVFQLLLVAISLEVSGAALTSVASFALINSMVGIIIFYIINYLKNIFRIEPK